MTSICQCNNHNPRFDQIEIVDTVDENNTDDDDDECNTAKLIDCRNRLFVDIGLKQVDDDNEMVEEDRGSALRRRLQSLESGYGRGGFGRICSLVTYYYVNIDKCNLFNIYCFVFMENINIFFNDQSYFRAVDKFRQCIGDDTTYHNCLTINSFIAIDSNRQSAISQVDILRKKTYECAHRDCRLKWFVIDLFVF